MPNRHIKPQISSPVVARIIRLTDIEQLRPLFSNWQGKFEQLTAGSFQGTLRVVDTGGVRVTAIEGNQRVLLRGRDAARRLSIHPVTAGNAAGVWQGCRLTPGQLVVLGAEGEVDHCSARRTEALGLSLDLQIWDDAVRSLRNLDGPFQRLSWSVAATKPESFADLQRRLNQLLNRGLADPTVLGTAEGTPKYAGESRIVSPLWYVTKLWQNFR